MRSAISKVELETLLGKEFKVQEKTEQDFLSTGVPDLASALSGLPRGALTEIVGPASSGRTSLLISLLAEATASGETCALVDTSDAFDPRSASAAGADLDRLLWVRCGGNLANALKVTDMLSQAGGFGVVALDIADVSPNLVLRVPLVCWFRYRRAVENTRTVMLVVGRQAYAKTSASLILETNAQGAAWSGTPGCSELLRSADWRVQPRKPVKAATASFRARAIG